MADVQPPGFLDLVPGGANAQVFRDAQAAVLGAAWGSFTTGIGVTNGAAHGVCGPNDFLVTQSGTPASSVDVAGGRHLTTLSGTLGVGSGRRDASGTLAVAPNGPGLLRKDLVIIEFRPNSPDYDWRVRLVQGVAHASTPADPAVPINCQVLARVNVPANGAAITNAMINDLRTFAGTAELENRRSTLWTPSITNLTLGNGTATGRKVRIGPFMYYEGRVLFGSTTALTGVPTINFDTTAVGRINGSANLIDVGTRAYVATVQHSTTTTAQLLHTETGALGYVNATAPFTWTTGDSFDFAATFLAV